MSAARSSARHWRVVIGFAISVACLVLLVRRIDLFELRHAVAQAHWSPVVLGMVLLAIGYGARVVRWSFLLRSAGAEVRAGAAAAPFLASIALNNVLPLRAGDVVRGLVFPAAIGVPRTTAVASLVIERALDVGALAVMASLGVALATRSLLPDEVRSALIAMALLVPAFFFAAAYLAPFAGRWVARDGSGWRAAVGDTSRALAQMASAGPLLLAVFLSAVVWCFEAGLFWAVMDATGIDASLAAALVVCGATTLVTIVPSSPGYVGTFHAAAYASVMALGATSAQAGAFAVLSHLALWLPTTLAGAIALMLAPGLFEGFRLQRRTS